MKVTGRKARKLRGVSFDECRGQVCDARCWDAAVRSHGFERRLSTPGSVRTS